ncbi:hypothetical protein DL95DRAFT_468188 [Leptodontidium sp. 2 PMI_412]|nr:hypothetical protein DL95DRAFT_468188 [Leptodontidium sp. 2 PMI_412]
MHGLKYTGFVIKDRGPDKTGGVEKAASEEKAGSIDQSRSAQSDNSGGSLTDPIVLLAADDSSASRAEVDDLAATAHTSPTFAANLASSNGSIIEERQIAAGGGAVCSFTIDGTTSATWKLFMQTFAAIALGSWDLGPTPAAGSIGLGNIAGTVGATVSKRAVQTPAPVS